MSWHVDTILLERYVAGSLPDAAAWSVEAHVTACGLCRGSLEQIPTEVDEPRLDAIWAGVSSGVRARHLPLIERALVRAGIAPHDARLLAATPSLTVSWLLGIVLVLGTTVVAAWLAPPNTWLAPLGFLLVAPLVPVAGVAVAFGPKVDPAYELTVVAPMRNSLLLLLRAAAVLASSMVLAGVAALALPGVGWSLVAWVVPAFMLTSATLAISSYVGPLVAGAMVTTVWVTTVLILEFAAFQLVAQVVMTLLLILASMVLAASRPRLDLEPRT